MNAKKLTAVAVATAVLTLGAGTTVLAQGGAMQGQEDGRAITGAPTVPETEAGGGNGSDESLTGSPARKAAGAALDAVPSSVLEVERGDDPGAAYEVEVREADGGGGGGGGAEVLLDGDFKVIGQEAGD